jgi:hypothetical protein
LRRPAELALDLLDELADLGGRGVRLLALDADKRNLVFSIVEQNVKDSVGHESYTNDSNKQRDIFAKQAAPSLPQSRLGRRGLARAVIALPFGRARLLTRPSPTGSWLTKKTMGIVVVAALTIAAAGPFATIRRHLCLRW